MRPTSATLAIRLTRLAQEKRGDSLTIPECSAAIGWHPVSDGDLQRFLRFARTFGVRLNTDGEEWHERYIR